MEKTKELESVLKLDLDLIIKKKNKDNPELRQVNREEVSKDNDFHKQIFVEWKKKAPKSIVILYKMLQMVDGFDFKELIEKSNNK